MSPLTESTRTTEVEAGIVIVGSRTSLFADASGWRPAINAYRCDNKLLVYVDLAGVPPESVELTVQPGRLVIRGARPTPEPDDENAHLCQLIALEIDHGSFERVLDLPPAVNPDDVTTEYRDGLFRIALGLRT
jgi:HSP20 family protein